MSPEQEHIHKYRRIIVGNTKVIYKDGKRYLEKCPGTVVMKCISCPVYKKIELMEGHKSLCWRCGKVLVLNQENLKLVKPTHITCRRVKEKLNDEHQDNI